MHQRSYFGTDGIRDVANRGRLTPDKVLRIGHAIGKIVHDDFTGEGRPRVVIVRDTRVSGPMISNVLSGALMAHGVDVYDAGVLPTPAAALLVRRHEMSLGIVISASHNPMPDNGIKIFGPDGRKLSDDTELAIEKQIEREGTRDVDFVGADVGRLVPFEEGGNVYLEAMVQDFFGKLDLSEMRLVIDCANGSCSRISPRILAALGADVTPIHCDPDGLNINDSAGVFHAADMAPMIAREKAHLGMAMDGDGDRVILVDENGKVCDGDVMLAILSRNLGDGNRQVVTTVMSNMGLHVFMREAGVQLHQTPVGDRYVAERMESSGAAVGGEQSGHIIFSNDDGWFGDGVYTALRVIEVMQAEGKPLSELAAGMERFPQVLEGVVVSEKPPLSELTGLQESLRKHQLALGDDGRILVRYSGTENLARVMVEGRDEARIKEICADLVAVLGAEIGV